MQFIHISETVASGKSDRYISKDHLIAVQAIESVVYLRFTDDALYVIYTANSEKDAILVAKSIAQFIAEGNGTIIDIDWYLKVMN